MKKRIIGVSAAGLCATAALLYISFPKEGAGTSTSCPLPSLPRLSFPGCGSSRALRALLHFDFYQALRYNALFTVCAPVLGAYVLVFAYRYVRYGNEPAKRKIPLYPLWILCGIAVCYGILRNIPAFSFLAPTMLG